MTVAHDQPIVITMGDPSGVGAGGDGQGAGRPDAAQRADFAVIGDRAALGRAMAASGVDLRLAAPRGDGIACA